MKPFIACGASSPLQNHLRLLKVFQFIALFTVCSGLLLYQSGQCIVKYSDRSTGTADKYVHVSMTNFPVMTVCPTNPYRTSALQKHGIFSNEELIYKANWVSNDSSVLAQEFYEDVVYKAADVVKKVSIFAEGQIEGKNIFALKPDDKLCHEKIFYVQQHSAHGDCFSLRLPHCLRESGVLEVVIENSVKVEILIHHEGQFLDPNSSTDRDLPLNQRNMRSRVDVTPGRFVKMAANHEVVQLLGHDDSCVHIEKRSTYSSIDDCMYSRLTELMMAKVNCTVPWLPDQSRICIQSEKREEAFKIYQENLHNQDDICPKSCLFTNMNFGPPVTGVNNVDKSEVGTAVFYFRRDIKTTKEYFLYSLLSMMAEIGSYVGLLLGASLFKVADINNTFLDWVIKRESKARVRTNSATGKDTG